VTIIVTPSPASVYSTYALLQAGVIDWAQRADLTSKAPTFIELAEHAMFRELPLRASETTLSGTTSGDTIAIPAVLNAIERVELTVGTTRYTLGYTSPNDIERLTIAAGLPTRFTVENGSIRLIATPQGAYSYSVYYLPTPDFLSSTAPSNALLSAHPDVYLWGSLTELARYIMDDQMEAKYLAAYTSAVDSIRKADERKRLPISGGLQTRVRTVR
jgi:hypothetical protein